MAAAKREEINKSEAKKAWRSENERKWRHRENVMAAKIMKAWQAA